MMKWRFFSLLLVLTGTCLAQTYVSGAVSGVWDSTGSPYYVTDTIYVPTDDSLRIMPGCSIIFQGHYRFRVDSAALLKAIGTLDEPIIFFPVDSTLGWDGLRFIHSLDGCSLLFCEFAYGIQHGWSGASYDSMVGGVFCYYSNPIIAFSTLRKNDAFMGSGISFVYSAPTIMGNTIVDNDGGISGFYSSPIVCCNLIINNWYYGMHFTNCDAKIINNTVVDNPVKGIIFANACSSIIMNCIIRNNEDTEIFSNPYYPHSTVFITHSNFDSSDCAIGIGSELFLLDGNISTDPLFSDTLYHPSMSSPCVDAGAESVYISIWDTVIYAPTTDLDGNPRPLGTGWDIGAYEYDPEHPVIAFALSSGWNLLSIPFGDTTAIADAFPYALPPAWSYDPIAASYYVADTVFAGTGFWLMALSDTVAAVYGTSEATTIADTLYPGWNLIGAPSVAVPESVITSYPEVIGDIFGWDAPSRSYTIADFLQPGFGYWVLAIDTVEIEMP